MDNEKDLEIIITDKYGDCLSDSNNDITKRNPNNRPQGFVEIYEIDKKDTKKLLRKSNLVVYKGREWLLSKVFNKINPNIDSLPTEWINWFGVGNGGCPIGDPLNPIFPTNLDTDLGNSVMINPTDLSCADYRLAPDVGYYKHPLNSEVTFEQDGDNYNYWLIGKVSITIGADDANDFYINEVGLFTSDSDVGGYAGPFNLYARTTFPSIVKTFARQLLFIWYVYF